MRRWLGKQIARIMEGRVILLLMVFFILFEERIPYPPSLQKYSFWLSVLIGLSICWISGMLSIELNLRGKREEHLLLKTPYYKRAQEDRKKILRRLRNDR